jgi:AcrR family transcriptional regulator
VSPTRSERPDRAGRYHHGDLKAALIDVAVELIAERGVRDFSLAEASRRLGVTVAAPYRHFADRDELLAAVSVRALETLGAALAAEVTGTDPPERRLAGIAGAYVRFAGAHRALFETLFGSGIDKDRFPEVRRAAEPVETAFTSCVLMICADDAGAAAALAGGVLATAHGYATLLLDETAIGRGPGGEGSGGAGTVGGVDVSAAAAERAVLALVAGRSALPE